MRSIVSKITVAFFVLALCAGAFAQNHVLTPGQGGTGISNTATFKMGSANWDLSTFAGGVPKISGSGVGALTAAGYPDIVVLFGSGSCSGSLMSDGTCSSGGGALSNITNAVTWSSPGGSTPCAVNGAGTQCTSGSTFGPEQDISALPAGCVDYVLLVDGNITGSTAENINFTLNSVGGGNYSWASFQAAPTIGWGPSGNHGGGGGAFCAMSPASTATNVGACRAEFFDVNDTSGNFKGFSSSGIRGDCAVLGDSCIYGFGGAVNLSTAAISSFQVSPNAGVSFTANTTFELLCQK